MCECRLSGEVSRHHAPSSGSELDDILVLARGAGMLIKLDGQIGLEKYQSVTGSLASPVRFAETVRMACLHG